MPLAVTLFLTTQLLIVAYLDFKTKKIRNYWPLSNIVLFILVLFLFPKFYVFGWDCFYFPLGVLFLGFFLYQVDIMGAGDVKYLFSLFLILPVPYHLDFLLCLAYSTIAVGLILIGTKAARNYNKVWGSIRTGDLFFIKGVFSGKNTYAPVILLAWIYFGWKNQDVLF